MPLFNDKTVIPCEQGRRLVRVPTNRGSIKVQCPHCQATFMTPDKMITKKKCLNCGYQRQEKDDQCGIIPSTDCPKCGAIYEKVEKYLEEKERQEKERKEQEEREIKAQRERYRKHLEESERREREERVEIQAQQEKYRKDLEEREKETQQQPAIENIGWFKKKIIEATTKNIIKGIVQDVDLTLRANPFLSLEEALNVVNIKRGILPEEENIVTDLSSLFGFMVWKAYRYECARDRKSFSNDDLMLVMKIAYDYMNMVMSDSGLQPSVSGSQHTIRYL